ncbi:NUDIX domain-containing protein [Streptosporangium soli]|nr:NUDIX domain-containing protein [Streptosporangium sp. KLBMP 9127]
MSIGVGAILLRADGALLIGYRIKAGAPHSWCLPGGHVEPGESFESAALREIAEETGIREVTSPRVFTVALSDTATVTAGVVARLSAQDAVATTPEPHVFERWIWVQPDSLPGPLFPASAAVLAAWRGRAAAEGWAMYSIAVTARPPARP